MSSIQHLQDLHKASLWATDLLLDTLPEDYLDKNINSSFPDIESILIHLWNAQMVWHNRIIKSTDKPLPSKNYDGGYASLKEGVLSSFRMYTVLLADKSDDYLNETLTYATTKGDEFSQPNYQVLMQLTHHSAFHRGQIIGFMRQLGFTENIPQTDLIAWYRLFK